MQGELGCMKQSDEGSVKHGVSRLERMKLIKVVRKVLRLGVERVNCCLLFIW